MRNRPDPGKWRRALIALGALAILAGPALAQEAAPASSTAAPVEAEPAEAAPVDGAAPAAPSPESVQTLIETLNDDAARAALIRDLELLIQAEPAAEPEPLLEMFGARALAYVNGQLEALAADFTAIGAVAADMPQIAAWLKAQIRAGPARDRWLQVALNAAIVLALGLAGSWAIGRAIRRPREALEQRTADGIPTRLALALFRLLLDLVPLLGFVLAAFIALGLTDPVRAVRLVVAAFVNAALLIGVTVAAARALLAPHQPGLRLFRLRDETAIRLYRWSRRIAATAICGAFAVEAAARLGMPLAARGILIDLVALAVALMLIVFVAQNRRRFGDYLRGRSDGGALAVARRRLAEIWHVLAILYIAAVYAIFALNIEGGFRFMLRGTALSLIILIAARLTIGWLRRAAERGAMLRPAGLHARTGRYLPVVRQALTIAVVLIAALALLDVWGLGGFTWLATPLGRDIAGSALAIAIVLVAAIIVWETASNLITRYLSRTDAAGQPLQHSARTRTLLPLLRNALLIVLIVIVGLITLSELGVNIAPLLAGAGVVGLAVGFGSQALVKDVITGLFILFEDTVAIGDVVDVGNGHSGLVEGLSIRTIKLRDVAGGVHVVPFGEVSTVLNLTKDYSYYVFDTAIDYREDTDRVVEAIRQLGAELQQDPAFAPLILEPIEIMGVEALKESAVIIRSRFKTKPIQQWNVGREFNRRLKQRFDALGITIPGPHMTISFGSDEPSGNRLTIDAPGLAEALAGRGRARGEQPG